MKKLSKKLLSVLLVIALLVPTGSLMVNTSAEDENEGIVEFNEHYYKVFDKSMTWKDAKVYCENLGGYLATIISLEEQNFITSISQNTEKTQLWLGGTDEHKEGDWQWITGEEFDYQNWHPSNPDNYGRREHYLTMITKNTPYESLWNDFANIGYISSDINRLWYKLEQIGFICEWDSLADVPGEHFPEGYDFETDKYPFKNPVHTIDGDKFTNLFGVVWGNILKEMKPNAGEKGTCFGMATSTGVLLENYIKLDDITYRDENGNKQNPNTISEVWNGSSNHQDFYIESLRMPVSDFIDYANIYQWGPWNLWIDNGYDDWHSQSARCEMLYNEVYDYVYNNGAPVVVSFAFSGSFGGHTVLAVGLREGHDKTEILLDDSNYLEKRSIILKKDAEGNHYDWSFNFDDNTTYSASDGSSLYVSNPCAPFSQAIHKMSLEDWFDDAHENKLITVENATIDMLEILLKQHTIWSPVNSSGSVKKESETAMQSDKQLYWINSSYKEELSFLTSETSGIVEFADFDSSISIELPSNSESSIKIDELDNIVVEMSNVTNKIIKITQTASNDNENLTTVTIIGTANGGEVVASETENGIQVTGLNNITVTYETADGIAETTAKVDDGSTVNITVNDDKNTVETDWQCKHSDTNHDGICDTCSEDFTKSCSCNCHSNAFMQFLHKIVSFLRKLFGMNQYQYCGCGKAHW